MRRRNNKGFTLVELLVTISILGIVSVMAMPIIRNIVEANNMKKFITYKDSVESSAKLYVDSYAEDLFGKRNSGCTYVTYDQMQEKSLIKDIIQDSVSCDSSKTFVKVVKLNGKYSYSSQIGCGNSNEKNKNIKDSEINILYPKDEISKTEPCNFDSNFRFKYLVVSESYTGTSKKRLEVKIRLTSATGILHNGEEIYYTWRESRDDASKDTWTKASFNGFSNSKQENEILGGNDITIDSRRRVSPDKKTGNYYLAVKFVKVLDITGTSLNDEEKIVTFGPFNIDNDPPVINSLNIVSSNSSFNSTAVKVNIQATDNNKLSSIKELSVCIKTNDSECEDDDFEDYKGSYSLRLTGKYDGSTKKVYAWVKDNAGNISEKKEATYQVYKECSTVKIDKSNLISKGSCSKKCGGGSRRDKYGLVDKHTENKCSGEKVVTEKCNTMDCCSEVKYSDSESCSKKCGGGTYGQNAYSKYDSSIRCPSSDKKTGGSKCNTQSCCDYVTYKDGDKCSKTCGGGTYNRVAYSKTDGSRCPSKDTSSGGSSCNTQSCCEKFTYGSWNDWSSWGTCSAVCGTGKQTRTRTRPKFSTYDKSSCGNDVESQSRDCTIKPTCCTEATVSYSSWSDCSTSCGTGTQTRKKTTIPCTGSPSVVTEQRSCTVITPDTYVSSTSWSCNASCGTGVNERYNTYKKCDGSTYRVKETGSSCNTGKSCCSGDKLIDTSAWKCVGKCGNGTKQRTKTYQRCDGSTYTSTENGGSCNTGISCCSSTKFGSYGDWNYTSKCSKKCGGGTRTRERSRPKLSNYDNSNCGTDVQRDTVSCNTAACPKKPTCTIELSGGTSGSNGWYKGGTVTAKLKTSGTVTSYSLNGETTKTVTIKSNGKHSIKGVVKNDGGQNTCSKTVKYDKTKPVYSEVKLCCGDIGNNGFKAYMYLNFYDTTSGLGMRKTGSWDYRNNSSHGYNHPNQNYKGQESAHDVLGASGTWIGYKHHLCDMAGNCTSRSDGNVSFSSCRRC